MCSLLAVCIYIITNIVFIFILYLFYVKSLYFIQTALVITFSNPDVRKIAAIVATWTISRGINQQRASAYLPDTISIYENGDAIGSRLIFLTELGLGSSPARVP